MRKYITVLCLLVTIGCATASSAPDDGIPDSCYTHTARAYHFGEVTCDPATAETCAFGVHNQPTQLDQSGEPLAYYCTCDGSNSYHCWGAPGLAEADPLL